MLGFVVLGSSLAFVLGFESCSLLVTVLQVGVNVLGDAVDFLLQWGQALDPKFKFNQSSKFKFIIKSAVTDEYP